MIGELSYTYIEDGVTVLIKDFHNIRETPSFRFQYRKDLFGEKKLTMKFDGNTINIHEIFREPLFLLPAKSHVAVLDFMLNKLSSVANSNEDELVHLNNLFNQAIDYVNGKKE